MKVTQCHLSLDTRKTTCGLLKYRLGSVSNRLPGRGEGEAELKLVLLDEVYESMNGSYKYLQERTFANSLRTTDIMECFVNCASSWYARPVRSQSHKIFY